MRCIVRSHKFTWFSWVGVPITISVCCWWPYICWWSYWTLRKIRGIEIIDMMFWHPVKWTSFSSVWSDVRKHFSLHFQQPDPKSPRSIPGWNRVSWNPNNKFLRADPRSQSTNSTDACSSTEKQQMLAQQLVSDKWRCREFILLYSCWRWDIENIDNMNSSEFIY